MIYYPNVVWKGEKGYLHIAEKLGLLPDVFARVYGVNEHGKTED